MKANKVALLAALWAGPVLVGGCGFNAPSSSLSLKPAAVSAGNFKGGGAGYALLYHDNGLRILFLYDFPNSGWESGSGSSRAERTGVPWYQGHGEVVAADGRRFSWSFETPNYRKFSQFQVQGEPFDLPGGKVFLVTTKSDPPHVEQFDKDVSAFRPGDRAGIEDFVKQDPDLQKLLEKPEPQHAPPEAPK